MEQGGFMLELGHGDLLPVAASGVEALADGQLDGPIIPETLEIRVLALRE